MSRLKAELIRRLEMIDGIRHVPWPDRKDGFSTVLLHGKEIAHFHNHNEIDLRLGKRLIKREGLLHNPGSTTHPNRSANSPFIELRITKANDLDRVVKLVNLLADSSARLTA